MWFLPQAVGEYDLFCAEYCGLQHSYMNTGVNVLSQDAFDKWYKDTSVVAHSADKPPWQLGFAVLKKNGCNVCHSSDGSKLAGPSYLGGYGSKQTVETDGAEREIQVDDEYIIRSVYEPNADVVKGFNNGLILSYEGLVTEEEIEWIIEYFKYINK